MPIISVSTLTSWAQNTPADEFWKWSAFLIAIAIASFIGTFYCLIRKRIIQDTPTSKTRSAAQGYTELSGHGQLIEDQPITAPLTKTTCTWYSYEIEEHRGSGKNSRWVTIEKGASKEFFLLVDDTGQAVIDPDGANVTPELTHVWYGHKSFPSKAPKKRNSGFLSFGIGRYRYTEKRMHPGTILYALGLFKTTGGAGGTFTVNSDVRDLLVEWKKDSDGLLKKFDVDKDGEIDMAEWQKVREAALKETLSKHEEYKTAPPVHIMSKTCDSRRPYLLSAIPQSTLIKKYSLYSFMLIITFFISGAFVTYLVNARLVA